MPLAHQGRRRRGAVADSDSDPDSVWACDWDPEYVCGSGADSDSDVGSR